MMMIHNYSLSHRRRLGNPYYKKVLGYNPIAYWPLWEASGGVAECLVNPAQSGAYTGVTLGQPGVGDGRTAPFFDGANDYVNIFSAALDAVFNGSEGTMMVWARVFNAAVWADGLQHFLFNLSDNFNNNYVFCRKKGINTVQVQRVAGGVGPTVSWLPGPSTAWLHVAATWSVGATVKWIYGNGAPIGSAVIAGGWVQNFDNTKVVVGAYTTVPTFPWYGWLAHCAAWDMVLTPTQIADLAVIP